MMNDREADTLKAVAFVTRKMKTKSLEDDLHRRGRERRRERGTVLSILLFSSLIFFPSLLRRVSLCFSRHKIQFVSLYGEVIA